MITFIIFLFYFLHIKKLLESCLWQFCLCNILKPHVIFKDVYSMMIHCALISVCGAAYSFSMQIFSFIISPLCSECSFLHYIVLMHLLKINCPNNCGSMSGLWSVPLTHLSIYALPCTVDWFQFALSFCSWILFLCVGLMFLCRSYGLFNKLDRCQCPYIKWGK